MKQPKLNFSGISSNGSLGKLLRLPTKLIPKHLKLPILQGELKGMRWIVGSGNHGCWLGSYEYKKQLLFSQTIHLGSTVFDIGAHAGFYTLLASRLVGPEGKVIAFEPCEENINFLKEHLLLNNCINASVVESLVSDHSGSASFSPGNNSYSGHITTHGPHRIPTLSIDDLLLQSKYPIPDYIKIDVEGAEMLVLEGAKQLLANHNPTIFLATHGSEVHQKCCSFLSSLGYELKSLCSKSVNQTSELIAFKRSDVK